MKKTLFCIDCCDDRKHKPWHPGGPGMWACSLCGNLRNAVCDFTNLDGQEWPEHILLPPGRSHVVSLAR